MNMALARGRFLLAQRDKNLRDLAELCMVIADVHEVLQQPSVSDYCEGPLDDERAVPSNGRYSARGTRA